MLTGLLFAPVAHGQEPPWPAQGPWPFQVPRADAAGVEGLPIGPITVEVLDVYDPRIPGEAGRFGRTVNAIHYRSRESVVRRELLFREGEPLVGDLLAQSERNLRALGIFARAQVNVMPPGPDGRVPVHVRVSDGWSLQIGGGFGRSGGQNRYDFGIEEENFLGRAYKLAYKRKVTFTRNEQRVSFVDRRLFGRPESLRLDYSRLEDGRERKFSYEHPFLSIEGRHAHDVYAAETLERYKIYDNGEVIREYDSLLRDVHVMYRRMLKRTGHDAAWRGGIGWNYGESIYRPLPGATAAQLVDLPPSTRRMGPWFTLEFLDTDFASVDGLFRPGRVEDLNLGTEFSASLNPSATALGSTDNRTRLELRLSRGRRFGERSFAVLGGKLNQDLGLGWRAAGGSVLLRAWRPSSPRKVDALLIEYSTLGGEPGQYLYLGGSPGLRGFKENQFRGAHSALAVVEARRYGKWIPLRFLQPGLVFFAEGGAVWGGGTRLNRDAFHADLGVGLRLALIKGAGNSIIKVDFAIPVGNRPAGSAGHQVTVGFRSDF